MDSKEIKQLIDKYLDGLTSVEEEDKLRDFFTSPDADIPDEWRCYRALFRYEAKERDALTMIAHPENSNKNRFLSHRWIWIVSVAASIAIIVSLFIGQYHAQRNYAVIDGHMITNSTEVKDQAENALQIVSASGQDDFSALDLMR